MAGIIRRIFSPLERFWRCCLTGPRSRYGSSRPCRSIWPELATRCAAAASRVATVLVAALAFPAVFVNLTHGQNGFLTAGLFAGALLCLDTRPWLAGLLFALLAYKPQFGLVIPMALMAGALAGAPRWSCQPGGADRNERRGVRPANVDRLPAEPRLRSVVLEQGNIGWEKIQSMFAAVRTLGGTVPEAYAVQAAASTSVIGAIAWLWHSSADPRLKYAALLVAALLTTPYCLDYDMVLLGPALAFVVAHGVEKGFAPFEKSLLAAVWVVPLIARQVAKLSYIPLGPIVMLTLFALIIGRAMQARSDIRAASTSLAAIRSN